MNRNDEKDRDVLATSEARLLRAQRVARLGSWELDLTTRVMWGSDEAFRIYGLERTPDSSLPFNLVKEVPLPEYRPALDQAMADLMAHGTPYEIRFRIRRHDDGAVRWVHSFAEPTNDGPGSPAVITGTVQDVTEREEAEQALQVALKANEERARLILEQAADAIFLGSSEGLLTGVNQLACELTGFARDELVGRTFASLFSRESLQAEPLRTKSIEQGKTAVTERELLCKDGDPRVVETRSKMLSDGTIQAIVRDISERKRLEQELNLRQRMDSLGTLASGIAHDFNNILIAIIGNAEALRQVGNRLDGPQDNLVTSILQSCERAAHLVRGLRMLTQPEPDGTDTFDLCTVVSEVVHVLQETTDRLITKENMIPPGRFAVRGNASAIFHALMNLGINAVQAIEQKGTGEGGRVRFEAAGHEAAESDSPSMPPGHYVHVMVSDTGSGMDTSVQRRIFEPWFTTKEKGARKGQGLGLAAVYNTIVRQHKGVIEVVSAEGSGTTFHLYLHRGELAEEPPSAVARAVAGGGETILVVDDEAPIVELTRRALERVGYNVLSAEDGHQAIDTFRAHIDEIDLVVLDRTLPKMSGEDVLQEMLAMRPGARVIVSSGDDSVDLERFPGAMQVLHKPYSMSVLCEAISEVLELDEAKRSPGT